VQLPDAAALAHCADVLTAAFPAVTFAIARFPAAPFPAAPFPAAWISGFANPLLAWGVLAAAVPLAIHLLNRRRHRPLEWAAMRFVAAAWRRTRRRAELENLLLLLLRMGAVALLALALARPFAGGAGPLAELAEARADLLLVVDASASTGWSHGTASVFEREVERARELAAGLDGARGDRVQLVLAGRRPRLLSWTTPEDALQALAGLDQPLDEALDSAALFAEMARLAAESLGGLPQSAAEPGGDAAPARLEARLLTDLQRVGFERLAEDGRAALDRLAELGVEVIVEDLGPGEPIPANLALAELAPLVQPGGAGLAFEVAATVANFGPAAALGTRVALFVDGRREPVEVVDVPARGTAQALFAVSIDASGEHVLTAELEGDALAADDARAAVVDVPPPLDVLLVSGAPNARLDLDPAGLLEVALAPIDDSLGDDALGGAAARAPFAVATTSPATLAADPSAIEGADAIWLADVPAVAVEAAQALERRVAAGAALLVSLGPHTDPELLQERLGLAGDAAGEAAPGLLPCELLGAVAVASRRTDYYRVAEFDASHPALAFFADERWRALFAEVPVYAFVAARARPGTAVLAALDDERASPLLAVAAHGAGQVALWTSSFDGAWGRFADSPRTLVPLAHELLRATARRAPPRRNVAVGEPLAAEVQGFPRRAELVTPDGERRALDGEPLDLGHGRWRLPTMAAATRAGVWRIECEAPLGAAPIAALHFAAGLDPRESDLARLPRAELGRIHRALVAPGADRGAGADEDPPRRGELWRLAAALALALTVGDSLWAAFIGRRRR
jgi:hypothetical protein